MTAPEADISAQFSLVRGGPFHATLRRVGLLGADQLPTTRTAIAMALVAWLPPGLLAVVQSLAEDTSRGLLFFTDFTSHTRYLLAIGVMIATERYAEGRFSLLAARATIS